MIDKYYTFNVDMFFHDYNRNMKKRCDLMRQREDILHEGGMDYRKPNVTGGKTSDIVLSKVERREKIEQKLYSIEEYLEVFNYILAKLTIDERNFVKIYFLEPGDKVHLRERVKRELGYSRTGFYRELSRIRRKVSGIADECREGV